MHATIDFTAAEDFMLRTARLVERLRFDFLFADGDRDRVLAALRPYQNGDGGFGHALEPDGRGSASQPLHVLSAIEVLDEIEAFDDPVAHTVVEYLGSIVGPNGGVPNVLPSIGDAPRPPWWEFGGIPEHPDGALIPTGQIAGTLLKHHVDATWLPRAIEYCWDTIERIERTHPYEVIQAIHFLDRAQDRPRAEREAERIGGIIRKARLVAFDLQDTADVRVLPGFVEGEFMTPLDYASHPDSLARRWFTDDEIAFDLDQLAEAQDEDGGWWFRFGKWNTTTTQEWRGVYTINALKTLRAYGRL